MKCAHCATELVRATKGGTPMLRTKGLLVKAGALVAICPNYKCKADVPMSADVMETLHVFFQRGIRAPDVVTED